ncbi:MAG: class I SAM-dependent methyltransferase [Promethearchaeota archaeon]
MTNSHVKKRQDNPQSNLDYKIMSFFFAIRDKFKDPMRKVKKINIKEGNFVLDYGCGPGSFTISAAKKVGASGKVFAVDIHPLAIKKVQKKALKKGLKNIETILTNCKTELKNNSIDIIICFDTFHCLKDQESILGEFFRILKPASLLFIDDHHMQENEIISRITEQSIFRFVEKIEDIYVFSKEII